MSDGNHGGQFNRRGVVSDLSGNLQTGFVVVYRTTTFPIRPGFVTFLSPAETFIKEFTPMCAFLSHAIPN